MKHSLIITALALTSVIPAHADDTDALLYFYGYTAPSASMVTAQNPGQELFLFWGADGVDLVALGQDADIVLQRDGQTIEGPFRMGQVRPVDQIALRYAAPSEARRLLATMDALQGGFGWPSPTTPLNFATRLHAVLNASAPCLPGLANCAHVQRAFGQLLARTDANVAWALYLGTREPVPTVPTTYRLVATRGNLTKVVGEITLDPSTSAATIAAPPVLEDVSNEQQRCDVPGLAAHGTLAVAWDPPYSGAQDAPHSPISSTNIAGYLAFATPGPCVETDLNTLARTASFDTRGDVVIPGLLPLADSIVRAANRPEPEATSGRRLAPDVFDGNAPPPSAPDAVWPPNGYVGPNPNAWRPTFASLTVSAARAKSLGLSPGQAVCVHVAPLDRAGQIGKTRSAPARVADYEKPPAPWDVRVDTETERIFGTTGGDQPAPTYNTTERFTLTWRPVTAKNLLAHQSTVTYDSADNATVVPAVQCNPGDPKRVTWADTALDCADPSKVSYANLDIAEYLVYRFEDQMTVEGFLDTDGDGLADLSERTSDLDPGAACSFTSAASPVLVGRIDADDATAEVGSKTPVYTFEDTTPTGLNKGTVFWYLVAARGHNGWVGPMSAPIRGIFHDTLPITPPVGPVFGTCEPALRSEVPALPTVAIDLTDDSVAQGGKLRLYCLSTAAELANPILRKMDGYVGEAPFLRVNGNGEGPIVFGPPAVSTTRPATADLYDAVTTAWLVGQRGSTPCFVYAEVTDALGRLIATSDPNADLVAADSNSGDFALTLYDGCTLSGPTPVQPGQVLTGPLKVSLPPGTPDTVCADINYEADDGNLFKLSTLCGANTAEIDVPDDGGGLQCLSVVYSGPNKVPNAPSEPTCVKKKTSQVPAPPSLWALELPHDTDAGTLRWKPPSTPIAGIIVQLEETTTGVVRSQFLPSGELGPEGLLLGELELKSNAGLSIQPSAGATQNWCVKARSLSAASTGDIGGMLSDWVGPLCGPRAIPGTALPNYLPWPAMSEPPTSSTVLPTSYLPNEGVPVVLLGTFDPKALWPDPDTTFDPDNERPPCGDEAAGTCYTTQQTGSQDCLAPEQTASSTCIDACGLLISAVGDFDNVIAYRKSRPTDGSEWGPWLQVSPVVGRPFCFPFGRGPRFGLLDPSFVASRFAETPEGPVTYRVGYVDRYPHEPGTTVRYAFIRFGLEGQILGTITTTELAIPQEVAP